MSRVVVIGSESEVNQKIGDALAAFDFPIEYALWNAEALRRLRMRSFGVVVTSPDSTAEDELRAVARSIQIPARDDQSDL